MNIIFDLLNSSVHFLYSIFNDWGISIIALTLIIKILLLPLTIKQKKVLSKQQQLTKKLKDVEITFKDDYKKIEEEKIKLSSEMAKNYFGCLITLIQIPIIFSLYKFFINLNPDAGSIILPWISNLSLSDSYYIIPIIAVIIQLIPNIQIFKSDINVNNKLGISIFQMLLFGTISFVILLKSPVVIGIYWTSSGIFNIIEKFLYNKLSRKLA